MREIVQRIKVAKESKTVKRSEGAKRVKVELSETDLSRQANLPGRSWLQFYWLKLYSISLSCL